MRGKKDKPFTAHHGGEAGDDGGLHARCPQEVSARQVAYVMRDLQGVCVFVRA